MPSAVQKRNFSVGDSVRVSKKTRIVDKEREHEHLSKEDRVPIDEAITGAELEVIGDPYQSPTKGNEFHVPCSMDGFGIVGVPLDRLERVNPTAQKEDGYGGGGSGVMSKESMSFWKGYFAAQKEELKKEVRAELEKEMKGRRRRK